jgi:hypothetical protein
MAALSCLVNFEFIVRQSRFGRSRKTAMDSRFWVACNTCVRLHRDFAPIDEIENAQ